VRIDATALDSKNHQVSDLTGEDFEIYQDGKLQKITACKYISENQDLLPDKLSSSMLTINQVRRTIIFVVDDLAMTFEQIHFTRSALKKFVESQMRTADLVAIFQSSHGIGAQQLFSSDKRLLLSAIKNIQWSVAKQLSNNEFRDLGLMRFGSEYLFPNQRINDASVNPNNKPDLDSSGRRQGPDLSGQRAIALRSIVPLRIDNTLATSQLLDYSIQALQDMPGRKSLILMSPRLTTFRGQDKRVYESRSNKALRAGVVVHGMDMRGVDATHRDLPDLNFFPAEITGGVTMTLSNAFFNESNLINESLKGYYLLSFAPPEGAFIGKNRELYHQLKVKVKKSGIIVRSRDGYFSDDRFPDPKPQANSLQYSIFSPFLKNDLNVNLQSSYAYEYKSGFYTKAFLHLDGKALVFNPEKNGHYSLSLEVASLATNDAGNIQDSNNYRCQFLINQDDLSRIRNDGFDFSSTLSIKNSGDYYIRVAIKDISSGKIGTGYQFLTIPDLKKVQLAISSIFPITCGEDALKFTLNKLGDKVESGKLFQICSSGKSPALRQYVDGENFEYSAFVYNAKVDKEQRVQLEIQHTILKDGQIFYQGNPEEIDSAFTEETRGAIIKSKVALKDMAEGTYLLLLKVSDKKTKDKNATIQTIEFAIHK
jgi:VWFA-related protein